MSAVPPVFVVGCPRSGTTVLQSCLAAHPRIHTFPESRLLRSVEAAHPLARRLGLASPGGHARLSAIYPELGFDPARCRPRRTVRGYVLDFAAEATAAAARAGRDTWLEKTPDHLHGVALLARWLPGARFVHILRRGVDNVCALVDITRRHRSWGPVPWTPAEALARWTRDAAVSLACAGRPGHLVLRHIDLVERSEAVIRAADRFLGLDFHPAQLAGLGPERVATEHEPWKQTLGAGVVRPNAEKYKDLLTPSEQAEVERGALSLQARVDALPAPENLP
jgi:Sulfotransferase family